MVEEVKCKLIGQVEISLSRLNNIKDKKLALYPKYLLVKGKGNIDLIKEIILEMRELDKDQEEWEDKRNNAIYQRLINKREMQLHQTKKIDGINIKVFRALTIQLYDKVLPKVCLHCGSKERLTIHHLRYKYPIDPKDLVRLCRSCHSKLEQKIRKHKKNYTLTPSFPLQH